jgi:hypothetical protein
MEDVQDILGNNWDDTESKVTDNMNEEEVTDNEDDDESTDEEEY